MYIFVAPSELCDSLVRGGDIKFYYQAVMLPNKLVRPELGIQMRKLFKPFEPFARRWFVFRM